MWFCTLVGLCALASSNAFNVETKHYTIYEGARFNARDSMFGFSVAEYADNFRDGWVIIGAPKAQTRQEGVIRGGQVFRCDVSRGDNACQPLEFDEEGHNFRTINPPEGRQLDNKTMQWFGATVAASTKSDGTILACAPRYQWFTTSFKEREPIGTCYYTKNGFRDPTEYSPCRTERGGPGRQGRCQAGFSGAISKDGERLLIGAPGSWWWQGRIISRNTVSSKDTKKTQERNIAEDDSYLGYSVAAISFTGKEDSGIAAGMPRGYNTSGKIVLYDDRMKNVKNITGHQMGSYFGYAVAACDVDGDGSDDLIVGAPMHTDFKDPQMSYETGRIYVYYQGGTDNDFSQKFSKMDYRSGVWTRGRFGFSLASLKDINGDGYEDFAVGMPYGGPEDRGAVYIYHGSKNGVQENYAQVIFAKDLETPVRTFGFSVAGGLDLDKKGYPDLVVGSYESDTVMFFPARPVITLTTYLKCNQYCRTIDCLNENSSKISLDEKNWKLSNGKFVTDEMITACFYYPKTDLEELHIFDYSLVLDEQKGKSPRMFFTEIEGENVFNGTFELTSGSEFCLNKRVYITPNIRDKLSPMYAGLRMALAGQESSKMEPRQPRSPLKHVLELQIAMNSSVSIAKRCGSDDVCIPDLSLVEVKSGVEKYLIGTEKNLELIVKVKNNGEDAYEAMLNVKLPLGIDFVNAALTNGTGIIQCSDPLETNNTLQCDIGNPFPENRMAEYTIRLQPHINSTTVNNNYEFEVTLNSSNSETGTLSDNHKKHKVAIWIETKLEIDVIRKPEERYYFYENYTDVDVKDASQFGPTFKHNYTITNVGAVPISDATITLYWPEETLAGDELVYLLEPPKFSNGTVDCIYVSTIYDHLKLSQDWKTEQRIHEHSESTEGGKSTNIETSGSSSNVSSQSSHFENSSNVVSSGNSVTVHQESTSYSESSGNKKEQIILNQGSQSSGSGSFQSGNKGRTETDLTTEQNGRRRIVEQNASIEHSQGEERRRQGEEVFVEETVTISMQNQENQRRQQILRQEQQDRNRERQNKHVQGSTEWVYGIQRNYSSAPENSMTHVSGGTGIISQTAGETTGEFEGTVYSPIKITNILSSQDLEELMRSMAQDAKTHNNMNSQNYQRASFLGRVRENNGKGYIQLKDNNVFPLQDRNGQPIRSIKDGQEHEFTLRKGELKVGQDGNVYLELDDGYRIPFQGSFSHEESRTYTHSGSQRGANIENVGDRNYETHDNSYSDEASSYDDGTGRDYEMHETNSHVVTHSTERRVNSRNYNDEGYGPHDDNKPNPHEYSNVRHRRESDMVEVEEFKKFEKRQQHHGGAFDELRSRRHRNRRDSPDSVSKVCSVSKCQKLQCTVRSLKQGDEIWLSIKAAVKASTLKKIAYNEGIKITTELVIEAENQLAEMNFSSRAVINHEASTIFKPHPPTALPDIVPLWVVVLSACAGTVILLLLIYLLYKCGFFKRNRPTDSAERQPLNRNGHYQHGDD